MNNEPVIEAEWTGIIANSVDGVPWVGPLSGSREREYLCAGFSGHGMTTALLCGRSIAEMICKEPQPSWWAPTSACFTSMSPTRRKVGFSIVPTEFVGPQPQLAHSVTSR